MDRVKSYELLAHHLDAPEDLVDAIQRDAKDDPNQGKIKCLQQWKERKGCEATYLSLAQAFLAIDDRHCAECIVIHAKHLSLSRLPNQGSVLLDKTIPWWDTMTDKEKKDQEEKLVLEINDVRDSYSSCLTEIALSFQQRDVSIDTVQMLLLSKLPAAKSRSDAPPNSDALLYKIEMAPTLAKIFVALARHTSWFNYHLLEFIVNKLGNENEKAMWSEYKDTVLKPYLMRSLFRVPSKSFSSAAIADGPAVCLCLKLVDDVDLSAKEALFVTKKSSELLEVPMLELSSFDDGSVVLVFAMPEDVFNLYPPDSVLHQYIEYDKDTTFYYISANITTIL